MKHKIKAIFICMLLIVSILSTLPTITVADSDTIAPELTDDTKTEETFGFGYNTSISLNIWDNQSGINAVKINITYPDNSYGNHTMTNTQGATYQYNFTDSWLTGQFNYTVWVKDNANNTNISSQDSFNISADANITISTIKDVYYDNETINLTDPPMPKPTNFPNSQIGYKSIDGGDTIWLWNGYDNYYINTTSGIQLTNHKDDYWSHNVMMLGYYNNDQWNLMYRTDELTNFTLYIETDNESYVNVTFWKNLVYAGYPFKLAVRYHLGIDDNDLTIIPYIKNTGENNIPYTLGFGWELKDIQIDMTEENDYIEINGTSYFLNTSLNNSYTDLDETMFYIKEDTGPCESESLYLIWNDSLTYKVTVESRTGQCNAPVTLFIRIGTLASGQEKQTELLWHDATEKTFYFNSYDEEDVNWDTNPSYMVDGSTSNYASTATDGDAELCTGNNASSVAASTISKVEIRAYGYRSGASSTLKLIPVFGGSTTGSEDQYSLGTSADWSRWYDITNDANAPDPWTWSDVTGLDCHVEADVGMFPSTLYCSKIELRVTYTVNVAPVVSNPVPADESIGVNLTPIVQISVNDSNGDSMNITWLSNSSGSWATFGTNNTVSNGTYQQNFSNATENGKWWYWRVNVTDGINYTLSDVYSFYTGYQSKLENTGSTNISGYLTIQVQYYCNATKQWVLENNTIYENTTRTITSGGYIALDTIFNGKVNSSNLSFWNGTYQVYAALLDPEGNVLKNDNGTMIYCVKAFDNLRSYQQGWNRLIADGFGTDTAISTRGIAVYNNELYIGTESLNKSKGKIINFVGFLEGTKITMANGSYKNIEDINTNDTVKAYDIGNQSYVNATVGMVFHQIPDSESIDHYVRINNKLLVSPNQIIIVNESLVEAKDANVGECLIDINGSNVTITSSSNISETPYLYHFEIALDIDSSIKPNNLTYFANDLQVYPWASNDSLDSRRFDASMVINCIEGLPIIEKSIKRRAKKSDGCEIWRYNSTTCEWTELVGWNRSQEGVDYPAGFGNRFNFAVGAMKAFNGKLYVGTWQSPDNGSEIWRYDGSTWEQIIGPDQSAKMSGGFNDPHNMAISCFEIFTNSSNVTHLYAGTINYYISPNGFCQLWRSADGENWSKVVDKGFRDNIGSDPSDWSPYVWSMNVYQDELYVGTFTIPRSFTPGVSGCQLWRSDSGEAGDWDKVTLSGGDGFGEWENYGIRNMVNYNNDMYIGTGTDAFQRPNKPETEAIEVWRYNGTGWLCIVGDNSGKTGDWYDGFGNDYNKYLWAMIVADNKLWMGTSSVKFDWNPRDYDTIGCEIWNYNSTNLTPIIKDGRGEKPNGFGSDIDPPNGGARSMIEFPSSSGDIVVGTMRLASFVYWWVDDGGCQVWMRHK